MPTPVLKKAEKLTSISHKRNERLWQHAKSAAASTGKGKNYAYIMGIYKKSLGKERLQTMHDEAGWTNEAKEPPRGAVDPAMVAYYRRKMVQKPSPKKDPIQLKQIQVKETIQALLSGESMDGLITALLS